MDWLLDEIDYLTEGPQTMKEITFRVQSPWSQASKFYIPPVETTIMGRIGAADRVGYCKVYDSSNHVIDKVHWTDIKGYFPEKGPGYF